MRFLCVDCCETFVAVFWDFVRNCSLAGVPNDAPSGWTLPLFLTSDSFKQMSTLSRLDFENYKCRYPNLTDLRPSALAGEDLTANTELQHPGRAQFERGRISRPSDSALDAAQSSLIAVDALRSPAWCLHANRLLTVTLSNLLVLFHAFWCKGCIAMVPLQHGWVCVP